MGPEPTAARSSGCECCGGKARFRNHCLHQLSRGGGNQCQWRFGPDLTHLMSRATIASGAAQNTPEKLRLWIQDPNKIKPGSLMPAMQLSHADLDAVVSYL